jgi:hypothetical protein
MSAAWTRFVDSLAAPVGRARVDRLDLDALGQLSADERAQAEALLIDQLARSSDGRVADALTCLPSPRVVAALKQRLPGARGLMRVAVGRALGALEPSAEATQAIVDVLMRGGISERVAAAAALRGSQDAGAEAALLAALEDADQRVRLNALAALFAKYGLEPAGESYRTAAGTLPVRVGSPLASIRRAAITELRSWLDALRAGQSPAELGVERAVAGPDVDRLVASLNDRSGAAGEVDLATLSAVAALDRSWLEHTLLSFLPGGDPRIARALGRVGGAESIAALEEFRPRAEPAAATAIDEALVALRARA